MNSRIARLAARLEALARTGLPADDGLRITRWGESLVIPLPPGIVAALDLRDGDQVQLRTTQQRALSIDIQRQEPAAEPPVAGGR